MGFRFRRSVKLMPGVRLNYGIGRSSLSIGGKGTTLNLSSRGARTTFSLPGTGISWSTSKSRSSESGRTPTKLVPPTHTNSQQNTQAQPPNAMSLQAQAEAIIKTSEDRQKGLINSWRDLPSIPSNDDYTRACTERPAESSALLTLDEQAERRGLAHEIETHTRKSRRKGLWLRIAFVTMMFPCVFGLTGGLLIDAIGGWSILVALMVYGGFAAGVTVPWKRETQRMFFKAFEAAWPEHWRKALEKNEEYKTWPEREQQRAAWARRLLAGEVEALEEAVSASLEDLDFPFETQCQVAVPSPDNVFVLLDLPEIENVIPETEQRALKNGTIKEVKRTKTDRNEDYLHLVSGLALWIARTAFAAGPTVQKVNVAAYTQRRQRGSGILADEYVYEAIFDRADASQWVPATVDPVKIITAPSNRLDLRDNHELMRITPPSWLKEFQTA